MKNLFYSLLFLSLTSFKIALGYEDTTVSTEQFCDKAKGAYKIEKVNGVKPKTETEMASVEKDSESKECILTFPYCIGDTTCDPGYVFFGFSNTTINRKSNSENDLVIESTASGRLMRFGWKTEGAKVTFSNYQYTLPDGKIIVLEFETRKTR